jgi:hypothetical protein
MRAGFCANRGVTHWGTTRKTVSRHALAEWSPPVCCFDQTCELSFCILEVNGMSCPRRAVLVRRQGSESEKLQRKHGFRKIGPQKRNLWLFPCAFCAPRNYTPERSSFSVLSQVFGCSPLCLASCCACGLSLGSVSFIDARDNISASKE